jgi:hypothetical protein
MSTYDWTTDDGKYRHFYFSEECPDSPADVLALVERCIKQLGDITQHNVLVRYPLSIERDRDFSTDEKIASVRMRVAVALGPKRINSEVKYYGLGESVPR